MRIITRNLSQPRANGILLDVVHRGQTSLPGRDLAPIEAFHPHIGLALQSKGKPTLYVLHGFLQRDFGSWREQNMEVIRHDDESMQEKLALIAIAQQRLLEEFRVRRPLKEPPALGGVSRYQVGSSFLWSERHSGKHKGKARG
jgi:hypothetical protein